VGSTGDGREAVLWKLSRVWLWELMFEEGVAWRSHPGRNRVTGWSSASVLASQCRTSR